MLLPWFLVEVRVLRFDCSYFLQQSRPSFGIGREAVIHPSNLSVLKRGVVIFVNGLPRGLGPSPYVYAPVSVSLDYVLGHLNSPCKSD